MSARAALGRPLSLLALATALAAAAAPAPVAAQAVPVVTDIVPDFDPGRGLGTTLSSNSGTHTIDGGTLAGANLFHSFASFSLAQGEIARWVQSTGDPASIAHVINRVTGGGTSFLSGTLDSSAIPNADFWFVNPAGIVFGTGAQVNVPAAAHFSTASGLNHVGGGRFEIATPDGSTLSVAPPESFGFVGGEADILISATNRIGSPGPLGLTAANIALQGTSMLTSGLVLAAVGENGGVVALDGSADRALTGQLTLVDAEANTIASARGAGDLAVNAGEVVLSNGQLGVFTIDATQGGDLTIDAARVGLLDGSRVVASSSVAAAGDSGGIRVSASESISVFDSSVQADAQGSGRGGDVLISAPAITFDNARLAALTFADGNGGNFSVRATGALTATDTSVFNSSLGTGATGDVLLHGGTVSLTRLFVGAQPSTIGGVGNVRGGVGDIRIVADGDLSITSGTITTETFGAGNAGDVSIAGGTISLTNVDITASTTNFSDDGPPGDAGSIDIAATGSVSLDTVNLSSAAEAQCFDICPSGNAGSIGVSGSDITIFNSNFRSEVFGNGNAGAIGFIASGSLGLTESSLSSGAFATDDESSDGGFAGAITLSGNDVSVLSSSISASTFGGDGGFVQIAALGGLDITDSNLSSDTFGDGDAGGINLSGETVTISDLSSLSSDSFGAGDAGRINIDALNLNLRDSFVSIDTFGTGTGNKIRIAANSLLIENTMISSSTAGDGLAGSINVFGDAITINDSELTSRTDGVGFAGSIDVQGNTIAISNSTLTSSSASDGDAGFVALKALDSIDVAASLIESSATGGGFAGFVGLRAPTITLTDGTEVSTDSALTGVRNFIAVSSDRLTVDASFISANTFAGFKADATYGLIFLDGFSDSAAKNIILRNGSAVRTNSTGPGDAGDIEISAQILVVLDSMIQAESLACGAACVHTGTEEAGLITITTDALTVSGSDPARRAAITSNTATDAAAGKIGIFALGLKPSTLTLTGSQATISSQSSSSGDAGSIDVGLDRVEIADGGKITTTTSDVASGKGGDIKIDAATELVVRDGGRIEADTNFVCLSDNCGIQGRGGTITVMTRDLTLRGTGGGAGTYIRADSNGTADAGQITIDVAGDFTASRGAYLTADSLGTGNSGGIILTVGDALSMNDASISANALDLGNGGNVMVSARTIDLDNSFIASDAFGTGNSGQVDVSADRIALRDSYISSDSLGEGSADSVTVSTTGALTLDNSSYISADAGGGDGGEVTVSAGSLSLANGSYISSDVLFPANFSGIANGQGGNVTVTVAGLLELTTGSSISSNTALTTLGDSGFVQVHARDIRLFDNSSISSNTRGDGDAQLVVVEADATVMLDQRSRIESDAFGSGDAGLVFVDAPDIRLTQGSQISSDTFGTGDAQVVDIGVNRLSLANGSYISSDSVGDGNGGGVFIDNGKFVGPTDLTLLSGSSISTDAFNDGIAGAILLDLRSATLDDATIRSESNSNEGGLILLDTSDALTLKNGSQIRTNSTGEGTAGDIGVTAGTITLSGQSAISSAAILASTGGSGTIDILARELLELSGVSAVSTGSVNNNDAGKITITAGQIDLIGSGLPNLPNNPANARITSSNTGTGNAGDITILQTAPGLDSGITLTEGAVITTSSSLANAGQITIDMAAGTILRLTGRTENALIDTSSGKSGGASGGKVLIGQTSAPYAVILNGGSILALGQPNPDNLKINADFLIRSADRSNRIAIGQGEEVDSQFEDVSSGTVTTNLDVVDASRVLSGACPAARARGEYSQFARRPIGPYAVEAPPETVPEPPAPPVSLNQIGTALASLVGARGCR